MMEGLIGQILRRVWYIRMIRKFFTEEFLIVPRTPLQLIFGGTFHGINVGYSYEMYTGTTAFGNGSHELFVSYQTDINLQKKGRNKHKSVDFCRNIYENEKKYNYHLS